MSAVHHEDPPREPHLLSHEADGIREYDNPMPFWWSALFWASFIYSVLYVGYYMIGVGPGVRRDYDDDLSAFYQAQAAKLGDLKPTEETMRGLASDPKMMQAAAGMFRANCATCHAVDGGGGTGPNLCDGAYLNVKQVNDIYTVLQKGVVAKGMTAWSPRFGEAQLVLLSSYVAHLRETTPAAPKAPQGQTVPTFFGGS
jgi:cytochrome c oxidase cbb3-type subunit 3